MLINKPLILSGGAGGVTPVHTIDQSIRFNDDDSAYMHRTPSSSGNTKTFTYSVWFKLGDMASTQRMFLSVRNSDTNRDNLMFNQGSSGDFRIFFDARVSGSAHTSLEIERALRDPSAWYHLVMSVDTTKDVETERVRFYLNGERQTSFQGTANFPNKDQTYYINSTNKHSIGRFEFSSPSGYWDGYMAEIVLLDGTATDCNSFAEFNSSGIWIPKSVSSLTFGTNGFHINGSDASGTPVKLGDDETSNGNNYTTSGMDATDQVLDSPTNNFCVISKINMGSATGVTLKNGNLDGATSGTSGNMPASISLDSGKWYWEVNNHANGSGNNFGVGETPTGSFDQFTRGSNGNTVNTNAKTTTGSSGQIIGFKLDFDAGTLTHTTNGTSYSSTGSLTAGMAYAPHSRLGASSGRVVFNFGQDSTFGGLETAGGNSDGNGVGNFYYSVPSGFLAICTKNLGS